MLLKEGTFRFGTSSLGVVVAFRQSILDIDRSRFKYDDEDVDTQWAAIVDSNGKMATVLLEIEWKSFREKIIIPFNMKDELDRKMVKEIALNKKINFVNADFEDNDFSPKEGTGKAIWVEINRVQVLDWLEMEERGEDIRTWK